MKTENTRDKKELQIQDERQRDYASRFKAERYSTDGFCLHFHRNTELYCVYRGQVSVLVNGENKILTDGQACVINRLESHSYEVGEPADITYFHVGVQYMDIFYRVYPQNEPARWLTDADFNLAHLYPVLEEVRERGDTMSELEKVSKTAEVFAQIVKRYGFSSRKHIEHPGSSYNIIDVVQYIYDHYADRDLGLQKIADVFGYSPKTLSALITKYIDVDLRIFINDIRVQKVIYMYHDPNNRGVPLTELIERCGFVSKMTFYRAYDRNFKFKSL